MIDVALQLVSFGLTIIAVIGPGMLLAATLLPHHRGAGRALLGATVGLCVVPTVAFGAAMALGTNMNPSLLVGTGAAVSIAAWLAGRLR